MRIVSGSTWCTTVGVMHHTRAYLPRYAWIFVDMCRATTWDADMEVRGVGYGGG